MTFSLVTFMLIGKNLRVRLDSLCLLHYVVHYLLSYFLATCVTQGSVKPNITWHCDIDARMARLTCDPPAGNYTVNPEDLFNVSCKAEAGFPAITTEFSFPWGLQNESHSLTIEQDEENGMYTVREAISLRLINETMNLRPFQYVVSQKFWGQQELNFNLFENKSENDNTTENPDNGESGSESLNSCQSKTWRLMCIILAITITQ